MWWILLFIALPVVAVLPALIGTVRGVEDLDLVIVFNVLGAVTAGGGWVAAMVLACRNPKRLPRRRMISPPDVYNFSPEPPA